ncbi:MAG: right-handed parallel beta-helix repeat-containing protein [Verrucomicrobiota bacterium]|nr:right-handed parallel beta-helix repeat-containing protein [Verrucomicrobiota bacterium]
MTTKKLTARILFALALSSVLHPRLSAFAQGSLTPSGPPAPVMKSLGQIEPRTAISSVPFTITQPGSYYLTTNLTGVGGASGITIASGGVTLDLNGFALIGVPGSVNGVYVATNQYYTNLAVLNGTVRGWGGSGVEAYNGEGEVLERLTVSDAGGDYGIHAYGAVVRDCTVDTCGTNDSIRVVEGVLSDCTINNSLAESISAYRSQVGSCMVNDSGGVGIYAENGSTVFDCVVNNSYSDGIELYDSQAHDCVVEHNSTGIYVLKGSVSGCHVENNDADGVDAYDSKVSDCALVANGYGSSYGGGIYVAPGTVSGCHVEDNAYSGIYADASGCQIAGNTCLGNNSTNSTADAGIYLNSSNNRVEANHVMGSGNAGIEVGSGSDTGNIIIKNTVTGDGSNDFVLPGAQIFGPLITATGAITSSNPWANFAF